MKNPDKPLKKDPTIDDYRKMKPDEVLTFLHSNLNTGLDSLEVKKRVISYGFNEVEKVKTRTVLLFLKKFWGLTAWLLEIIIFLSLYLKNYADCAVVTGLLVMNSILGFWEEQKADRVVEELQNKLQITARVLREKKWMGIPARELIPGDIVRLRAGDFVPADIFILDGVLGLDQSALTGESMETEAQVQNIAYSGSIVKRGEATGIVILTGSNTYFGQTTQLIQIARPQLHVEAIITTVVKWLLLIVGSLLGIVLLISSLKGTPFLEMVPLTLVLLLSAIPVALPAMFTVSMAIGSMDLSKKNVLVTKLNATEDAAAMDILCVDKTGTITLNQLSIQSIIPFGGFNEDDVIRYGLFASEEANQDPIDQAFIRAAKEKNLKNEAFTRKQFHPFDADKRRTEASVRTQDSWFRVTKGAIPVILEVSRELDEMKKHKLDVHIETLSKKGYRTLAVAKGERDQPFELVGIVALHDQPRPESRQLIQDLNGFGISVKMLTGDALPIAREVAQEVGIHGNVISMAEVKTRSIQEKPLLAREFEESTGFAEIFPEDKYLVVKSLQEKGHIVGMTGDGVNDAPALKQAEVGIAVRDAVDVAKGAASIVLTGEGLSGILELVATGRMISQRITTWILSKISRTILQSLFIVLAYFWTGQYVVSAFAMILLLFVTDFVKIALSTDRVTISKKPETWNVTGMVKVSVFVGLLMLFESLLLLFIGFHFFQILNYPERIHTFTFELLFFFSIFSLFLLREKGRFWNSLPSSTLLVAIVIDSILAIVFTVFGLPGLSPIPISQTLFIGLYTAIFSLFINDFLKVQFINFSK